MQSSQLLEAPRNLNRLWGAFRCLRLSGADLYGSRAKRPIISATMLKPKPQIAVLQGVSSAFLAVLVSYSLADAILNSMAPAHNQFSQFSTHLSWIALGLSLTATLGVGFSWRRTGREFFVPYVVSSLVFALALSLTICLGSMSFVD